VETRKKCLKITKLYHVKKEETLKKKKVKTETMTLLKQHVKT